MGAPPLKTSACKFCQPRDVPLPHLRTPIWPKSSSMPVPEDTNIVCDICACYCSLGHCIDCLVGSGDLLWGAVDCIGHHGGHKWAIWVNFFANLKNYMSLEGEFRCCHLVFGVFRPQIHVFWGPMVKKSRISENDGHLRCVAIIFGNSWIWWEHCVLREQDGSLQISENDGYIVAIIFGNSSLYMATIFRNSWIRRKMDLFAA